MGGVGSGAQPRSRGLGRSPRGVRGSAPAGVRVRGRAPLRKNGILTPYSMHFLHKFSVMLSLGNLPRQLQTAVQQDCILLSCWDLP